MNSARYVPREENLSRDVADADNITGQRPARIGEPLTVARPIEGKDRIGSPVGQLPGSAAIDRLNPNISNTFLLSGIRQSTSIRCPLKPAVVGGQIANHLRFPSAHTHDRDLVNRGRRRSVDKRERLSIR